MLALPARCQVVETVCGDPRIAFVHNLVTPEEAEELKARAQDVGLKQSRVGGTNYWSRFQDLPKEVVQEDAIRNGRTSTSCRVDRCAASACVSLSLCLSVCLSLRPSPSPSLSFSPTSTALAYS